MLLRLPPELLSHIAGSIGIFWPPDKAALEAMSLTCRTLLPFARARLLRRIHVFSDARANKVVSNFPIVAVYTPEGQQITEIQLWDDAQRRVVRELGVDHLSPNSRQFNKKLSHGVLADLLHLLPHLELLVASEFFVVSLSDRLAAALSRLDLLRTVIIAADGHATPASGIFEFLSSLSPRASFDLIRINIAPVPMSTPSKRALPRISFKCPRILCIQQASWREPQPRSLSPEAMWAGLAACCGTSMAYLDMPIVWLHEGLLRAVAPTIRALCIRSVKSKVPDRSGSDIDERLLQSDISLPRLECLQLPLETARKILNLRAPMFSNVRILVVPRSCVPDSASAHLDVVWDNILRAKFEVVGIAAYNGTVNGRAPVQARMFPWRGVAALRGGGIKVLDCEDSEQPNLLDLLERGVCVRSYGLPYYW